MATTKRTANQAAQSTRAVSTRAAVLLAAAQDRTGNGADQAARGLASVRGAAPVGSAAAEERRREATQARLFPGLASTEGARREALDMGQRSSGMGILVPLTPRPPARS